MKNLFLYAKKELSQDAFLMWLLDNFNCEDETLAQNSKKILRDFCNLNKDCKISNLNVSSQSHKIDVSIFFKANGEKHALFIEDKVFSLEHSNQLEKYNNQIKKICDERKIKESNIHKVFYKTSIVYEDEINAIEKAGWKIYSIDGINNKNSIYKLFNKLEETNSDIFNHYKSHIAYLHTKFNNTKKPDGTDKHEWESYFLRTVKPLLNKLVHVEIKQTIYNYCCMVLKPLNKGAEEIPFLEIRSRDNNSQLKILLLTYGVENYPLFEKNKNYIEKFKEKINKKNGLLHSQNYAKQIAVYQIKNYITHEIFIEEIKKVIEEYIELMKLWNY